MRSAALNYLQAERRDSLDALPLPMENEMDRHTRRNVPAQIGLEEQVLLGHRDEALRAAIRRLSERDQSLLDRYSPPRKTKRFLTELY